MKLNDALNENWGAGANALVTPGAFTGQQVVQPITRQAFDIGQTIFNKDVKSKKSPKPADFDNYNDEDVDELNIYYDFADDRLAKQFKRLIYRLNKRVKTKERDDETK